MQSVCQLSRRWHQQFCRSPSFLSHQKCLQRWQPIRHYRQPRLRSQRPSRAHEIAKPTHTGDFVVREYDQYGSDPRTRRPSLPELDISPEAADIREQIKKLEAELNVLKQGPFSSQSEFMQSLPKDERAELLKALEAEGAGQAAVQTLLEDTVPSLDEMEERGFHDEHEETDDLAEELYDQEVTTKPLSVTLRVPHRHKLYVKSFNGALSLAQAEPDRLAYHLDLWKAYIRCQQHVPNFSQFVDEDVWDFLWRSQTKFFPRPKQVVMLAKDMLSAGLHLDLSQSLDYINALHTTGDTATAIGVWDEKKPEVGFKGDNAATFFETGIELYAAVGRPRKAQEIVSTAFENKAVGIEAWVSVINAWANSQKPSAGSSLWFCYLLLKQQHAERVASDGTGVSQKIPAAVLGQISSALLNTGRRDMALAVFKDLLVSDTSPRVDSAQIYADILDELQDVDKTIVSESIVNRIGLTALTAFPRTFKNKFFFGAWIKWLLGENKIEDAALVVELMQEYGIRPDPKHLNGIVGAWLREGSPEARTRAEEMAWAMIHSRIAQVQARAKTFPSGTTIVNDENFYSNARRLPRFLQRNVPPATIETFSVLLQRYTRQSDAAKAEHLTDIMVGPAQIKPNAFILNHWMYLSLRASDLPAMWQRYQKVKGEIVPDLETFAALWDGSKKNLDRATSARSPEYPTPRQLAREMKTWFDALTPTKRHESQEAFTRDLYEQIIRCFCLHSDIHGTFVILRLLRDTFSFFPHEDIARMILMALARMLPAESRLASRPRRASIKRRDSAYRAALGNLAGALQGIADEKMSVAIDQGAKEDDVQDQEGEVSRRVRLESIEVFLCAVLKRRLVKGGDLVNDLVVAGRAMGVEMPREELRALVEEAERYERWDEGLGEHNPLVADGGRN